MSEWADRCYLGGKPGRVSHDIVCLSHVAYHLDLPQRVVAVIVEIVRLSVVDAHYAEKQLPIQTKCKWTAGSALWPDDDFNVFIDLVLQDLGFGQLFVLVGRQPDAGKLAGLVQEVFGKKHGGGRTKSRWCGVQVARRVGRCCLYRRVGGEGLRRQQ